MNNLSYAMKFMQNSIESIVCVQNSVNNNKQTNELRLNEYKCGLAFIDS